MNIIAMLVRFKHGVKFPDNAVRKEKDFLLICAKGLTGFLGKIRRSLSIDPA
jgi:hypothetical protein